MAFNLKANTNTFKKISFEKDVNVMEAFSILPDPQTNGGLLIAVSPDSVSEVKELFIQHNLSAFINPIGAFIHKEEKVINVKN